MKADGQSNPTLSITGNPFCAYIEREVGTGGNRIANAPYFNFGALKTTGVDVQFDWGADFSDMGLGMIPGSLNLNFVLNWLGKYDIQSSPTGKVLNYAGTVGGPTSQSGSQFRYRTFTTLSWTHPKGDLGLRWRHDPSAANAAGVIGPTTLLGVKSHDEFDLFGSWKVNNTYSLRAGVDNLLDRDPEIFGIDTSTASPNSSRGTTLYDYDSIGRRFYVGIKARF